MSKVTQKNTVVKDTTVNPVVKPEPSKEETMVKGLTEAMQKPQKKSGAQRIAESAKFLDKEQVKHAVETINGKLRDLYRQEASLLDIAVTVGKELEALKNGMIRGTFYPTAEKECNLKRSTIKLYIQIYMNRDSKAVKSAKSIHEARQNLIDANKAKTGKAGNASNDNEPKVSKVKIYKGSEYAGKKPADLSPEDVSNIIIEAIMDTLEKYTGDKKKQIVSHLKDDLESVLTIEAKTA